MNILFINKIELKYFLIFVPIIVMILSSVPASISETEVTSSSLSSVESFSNDSGVWTSSSTQGNGVDKVTEAHIKITQFMIERNPNLNQKINLSNDDSFRYNFDEQLPVFVSFVNETSEELVIGLDYNSATKSYAEYESKIHNLVGEKIPFKLITGFVFEESCTSQTDDCRPIWGGIEMGGPNKEGTLTLPFATNDGKIGFIISGHVVDGSTSANVFQPAIGNPSSDHVGSVIANPSEPRSSDSAFVETLSDKPLEMKIFKSSGQSYNVIGAKFSQDTPLFTTISKMGKSTGETSAGILSKHVSIVGSFFSPLTNQVISGYASADGDSGAPIFEKDVGDDVYFLGIHVGRACFLDFPPTDQDPDINNEQDCLDAGGNWPAFYSPWESIQTDLNLVEFDEICFPPSSGDWNISQDCTMIENATITGNVIVNSPTLLTIPKGIELDVDFANQHLIVKNGAGVLIKSGGKIT